jgi:DNA invertase Pin-like site-specific DNA recombinase
MRRYIPPPRPPQKSHLRYFNLLTQHEQAQSVKRLIASHQSEHHVAELTGLSVETVRRIMGAS